MSVQEIVDTKSIRVEKEKKKEVFPLISVQSWPLSSVLGIKTNSL